MDATILIVGMVFVGLVGAVIYLIRDDKPKAARRPALKTEAPAAKTDIDPTKLLQRKLKISEEQHKDLELRFEAVQLELAQTKDREKNLLTSKSEDTFDREQYEKFKKEFQTLKKEVDEKENSLEKEIALRRQQTDQLSVAQREYEDLKKRFTVSQDAERKAQTIIETLTKNLSDLKRKIQEQGRIVQEHAVNKTEGEWISRDEFDKVEKELQEKEAFIKKMLSINKEQKP